MKLICSKANLVKSVSIVMKAVPSKTTMPILECILIDASAGEIKFTSNDMEFRHRNQSRRRDCGKRHCCSGC